MNTVMSKIKRFLFGDKRYNADIIKVKRCLPGVLMPKVGSEDAAGMDFYQPVGALKLLEVNELTETARGTGGIGSTGK